MRKGILRGVPAALAILLFGNVLPAQSSLALSSGSGPTGSPVSLDLWLTSSPPAQPAGIQWTFSYPASSVTGFAVTAGPILTAAGKTLRCAATSADLICVAIGINTNLISDGIVANVSVTLAATATSVPVTVSGGIAAELDGSPINTITTGGTASNTTIFQSPILNETFREIGIGLGTTTALTFELSNPNTALTLSGLAFTNPLPTGLVVASPNGLTPPTCGGGLITAAGDTIALTGATLAGGASCTFSVDVTADGTALTLLTNASTTVISNQAAASASAAASIFIGDPLQVSYFPNLSIGDSAINITNTGERGDRPSSVTSGSTSANTTGAICVNAYAFSADEQMVACCSCPVTPNGLVTMSVRNDLISNTLTPAIPSSVVVKLVATDPVGGTCTNSASVISLAGLAPGMAAWGTRIRNFAGVTGGTESAFTGSILSVGELQRLANLCNAITVTGGGFGICNSCHIGGLGATER